MSVSGSRAVFDIDLEEFERRLRAAGTPSAGVEDPLAELARLVDASRPKTAGAAVARPTVAAPAPAVTAPPPHPPAPLHPPAPPTPPATTPPAEFEELEDGALRGALDDAEDHEPGFAEAADAFEEEPAPEVEPDPVRAALAPAPRRPRRWLLTVSALVVAGVAMIGAVFALRGGGLLPGLPKTPPFIAAAQGPTKVQPPSDETVATSNDSGANLLKDNTQPNKVKVVSNEEQPVDLIAQTAQPPASPTPAPAAATDASGAPVVRGTVDTPVVVAPQPAQPAASPFPEPKPVRTISLRPDGTPIPASVADAQASPPPQSSPAPEPPKPAAKPAKTTAEAGAAQASTPKIDLPTKLSPPKSSARVVVAKTDTTAPAAAEEAPAGPAPAKPEKPVRGKTQEAAAEPAAPAAAEPAATSPGGWAVQLAAPGSESEANSVASKLNQKYASALGGSALGVHKATSKSGETIYRVRATGLSKADAAALCARIKGDGGDCFVAK
ncbi:SPOR domain-containing protein [Roseiarcus sp.]|uniref:SPOR domain-containing protein n=1 Tax=Roseiarcus sp. TaxID=1969460 RepID=UPI003F99CB2F